MNQKERNEDLQKSNTTLIQKVQDRETELAIFKARVAELVAENTSLKHDLASKVEALYMSAEMLMHKDEEIAEANQEVSILKGEIEFLRKEVA